MKWSEIGDNNGREIVLAGKRFQVRDGFDRKMVLDGRILGDDNVCVWVSFWQRIMDGLGERWAGLAFPVG